MHQLLQECRELFGPPPRSPGLWDRLTYLRIAKPHWCYLGDDLKLFFRRYPRLLRDGHVVWGHIIQANSMLFEAGPYDCPGEVVYCPSTRFTMEPDFLASVAHRLYELKGTSPRDGEQARIANYLTNERVRVFGWQVPDSIAMGTECLISTIYFCRRHLPGGRLCSPLLPMVVEAGPPHVAMVLPARYWSPDLVAWWTGASQAGRHRESGVPAPQRN